MFKNRSTVDVVVILLALMVTITIFVSTAGIIVAKIKYPGIDFSRAGEAIQATITTVVGALVGFVGGRALGQNEALNGNGQKKL